MSKKKIFDTVKHEKEQNAFEIQDIKQKIAHGILPLNPTRKFVVEERVQYGAHEEVYVREIFEDELYYRIESINCRIDRDTYENKMLIAEWQTNGK